MQVQVGQDGGGFFEKKQTNWVMTFHNLLHCGGTLHWSLSMVKGGLRGSEGPLLDFRNIVWLLGFELWMESIMLVMDYFRIDSLVQFLSVVCIFSDGRETTYDL